MMDRVPVHRGLPWTTHFKDRLQQKEKSWWLRIEFKFTHKRRKTHVKISLIRETEDNIRIYTPYSQAEWKIIQRSLPSEILKRIKFTIAPKSCTEGNSILLLNNSYMNFNEVFNILTDLFYYIHKTSNEFKY